MSDRLPPYLACLNPEQLAAVRHEGRGLLILAGAGSGKTRVITTKIAYLVRERGVESESILAVTFTNKAAREMRDRAASIEALCSRTMIRTFHSFGAWLLRRNAKAAGLDPNFTIYDDDDATTLLHGALPQNTRQECARMVQAIARAKDYGLDPDSPALDSFFSSPDMRRVYALYEERLRKTGNVDFGDLIRLPTRLLRDDELVRRRLRSRFRVILVDEYQDSNVAQFELLRLLAGSGGDTAYLCAVGDDDQSIYRFRGAEVRNILRFTEAFPGTDIIRLERNYRSYQSILDLAGDVVSHNAGRLGKTLRAERPGGARPVLALLDDQDAEVAFCAKICAERVASGGRWNDIAILYRTNAQSLAFEKEFARSSVPYRIVGSTRFYEREEIKDALAYLALVANGRDEVAFKRVVNKPARGIGEASVELLLEAAAEAAASGASNDILEAAASRADTLRGKARSGLNSFLSIIKETRSALAAQAGEGTSLAQVIERLIISSGLADYHRGQDEVAGTQKAANLEELVNAASLYPRSPEGLAEFLETIELDRSLSAQDEGAADAVTLITMHNTKGLEFPIVIVTGLEQGLFPRNDDEGEELEEQRRLFYVAITRAKDELYLTSCRWRTLHGRLLESEPSRFLTEIDGSLIMTVPGRGARMLPSGLRSGSQSGCRPGAATGIWRAGQTVYHEDYGSGVIVKVTPTPSSGPLVVVRFETGKQAQFFPKFTKKLEVAHD
jgi:DNA helicase-2/ATP-dependent DNA helicase PcrA